MTGIRVVVFDLGGVIIRICRTWAEGCRAASIDVRDVDFIDQHPRSPFLPIAHEYQTGSIDTATFCGRLSAAMNNTYSPDEVARVRDAWMLGEYPHVKEVVTALNALPLTTAALSNTSDEHWSAITRAPDLYPAVRLMQHTFVSHEIGLVKPDQAIYRHVERELDMQPGALLLFDDLDENIDAARECGWNAVRIDHTGDTAAQILAGLREHSVL